MTPIEFPKYRLSGALVSICLIACWISAWFFVGEDTAQGQVYRLIYLHVPCAVSSFFSCFLLFVVSVLALRKLEEKRKAWPQAIAEVGFLFTGLTLASGSIWGKPTWGTWWTWDARLTTTLLLALLYAGYLLVHRSISDERQRGKVCALLAVFIFADVPIIYKSVSWWRTLHQPVSLLREGGPAMSPEILTLLLCSMLCTILFSVWLIAERVVNITLRNQIEQSFGV